jgi:hypothetical protein
MWSRRVLLGITSLATSTALFAGTAHADRRTGLEGNLLIQDPDDVFPFPQLAVKHRNMIRLDYGGNSASGNGVLTLGNDGMAFGIALHRGDLLSPDQVGPGQELVWLGGVADPFANQGGAVAFGAGALNTIPTPPAAAGGAAVLPATVLDVMMGKTLSDTSSFGLRLGFGRGVQTIKTGGNKTGASQTFLAVQGGFSSTPADGLKIDLSANAVLDFANQQAAGDDVASGTNFRFGALARAYYPWNDVVDIGVLANVQLENQHTKVNAGDVKSNDIFGGFMAGVGPAVHLARAKIAAYGGLTLAAGKNEPNKDVDHDETQLLNAALPMVNMATEVQLLDWLFVRTGAQYTWNLTRNKQNLDPSVKEKLGTGAFNWSAGLGVTKNNFYLDGVISNAFMTNGPAFIGGGTPGFLAMASATYKFGDVFTGTGTDITGTQPAGTDVTATPGAVQTVPAAEPAAAPEPATPAQVEENAVPPAGDASGEAGLTGATTDTSVSGSAGASGGVKIGQ